MKLLLTKRKYSNHGLKEEDSLSENKSEDYSAGWLFVEETSVEWRQIFDTEKGIQNANIKLYFNKIEVWRSNHQQHQQGLW